MFASFFGTLIAAAVLFPEGYDWRYRVISNLLSPRDDPQFYRIPSIGVALAGALMLPFIAYFHTALNLVSVSWARAATCAFTLGSVALICAAIVVPQHTHTVLGFARLHEMLARGSALGLGAGMLCACACAAADRRARTAGHPVLLDARILPLWTVLAVLPIGGVIVCQGLLMISRSTHWGPPIRQVMRHSVFWHLGFWEWTAAAAVYLFFLIATLLLPDVRSADFADKRR